jgi:hypothetical protein
MDACTESISAGILLTSEASCRIAGVRRSSGYATPDSPDPSVAGAGDRALSTILRG